MNHFTIVSTLEESDKTEVRLGSSWIIPQPPKEKQQFSVQAVDFVKIIIVTWVVTWAVSDGVLYIRASFLPRGAGSEASECVAGLCYMQ